MRIPNFLKPFLQARQPEIQKEALELGAESLKLQLDPKFQQALATRLVDIYCRFGGRARRLVCGDLGILLRNQLQLLDTQTQLFADLGLITEEQAESLSTFIEQDLASSDSLKVPLRYQFLVRTHTQATKLLAEAQGEELLVAVMTAAQETAMEFLLAQDDSGCAVCDHEHGGDTDGDFVYYSGLALRAAIGCEKVQHLSDEQIRRWVRRGEFPMHGDPAAQTPDEIAAFSYGETNRALLAANPMRYTSDIAIDSEETNGGLAWVSKTLAGNENQTA